VKLSLKSLTIAVSTSKLSIFETHNMKSTSSRTIAITHLWPHSHITWCACMHISYNSVVTIKFIFIVGLYSYIQVALGANHLPRSQGHVMYPYQECKKTTVSTLTLWLSAVKQYHITFYFCLNVNVMLINITFLIFVVLKLLCRQCHL